MGTEYNTVYERQCTNHYQQSCSITGYREECDVDVDYAEDCFEPDFESDDITNYKLQCKNGNCKLLPLHTPRKRSPRRQNALSIACDPITKETCTPVPERSCHSVPRKNCHSAPVRRPYNMAYQVCSG